LGLGNLFGFHRNSVLSGFTVFSLFLKKKKKELRRKNIMKLIDAL